MWVGEGGVQGEAWWEQAQGRLEMPSPPPVPFAPRPLRRCGSSLQSS